MKIETTKLLGILGYPLGHSASPLMHNAAIKSSSLNYMYIPIEVKAEDLGTVVEGIKKMNFAGLSVTIPHKVEIIKYLDEIDESAKIIGAVNTVVIKDGKMKGYNTDGIGFLKSFRYNTNVDVKGKNIFILGAGGASRAISMTLAMNDVNKIYICNRTYERAESLSRDINREVKDISMAIPMEYDEIEKYIGHSNILINTTSVGMSPNIESSPLDKNLLNKDLVIYDAIYNPRNTKILQDGKDIGCKTVSGLDMLVYQGVEAFELWTGIKAPVDVMRNSVESTL